MPKGTLDEARVRLGGLDRDALFTETINLWERLEIVERSARTVLEENERLRRDNNELRKRIHDLRPRSRG